MSPATRVPPWRPCRHACTLGGILFLAFAAVAAQGASQQGAEDAGQPARPPRSALDADDEGCRAREEGDAACAVSALQTDARNRRAAQGLAQSQRLKGVRKSFEEFLQEEDPVLAAMLKIFASIQSNSHLPSNHTFWADQKTQFREAVFEVSPDAKQWKAFCDAGDLDSFVQKSCDPEGAGSALLNGVPVDAYFCGRTEGMDWGAEGKPVSDLCNAVSGTAYSAEGPCGSVGNKQLLLNLVHKGPLQWADDPRLINVPSLDCLLDIIDCDIVYCQRCAGRCDAR